MIDLGHLAARCSLKGAKLEALAHLEGFESVLIPQVVLHHAALDELHGKPAGEYGCVGVQRWHHLYAQ